jgi:hypothetical protein
MATVFFAKKGFIFGVFAVIITGICCAYAWGISCAKTLFIHKTFYFLAAENVNVQAGAFEMELQGGAGYPMQFGEREYAVMSVYFSRDAANGVLAQLDNKKEMTVLSRSCDKIYLKSRKEKLKAEKIKGGLSVLYACIRLLNGEISRLEKGATQESSARVLKAIAAQLCFWGKSNRSELPSFARGQEEIGESLLGFAGKVIFTQDLRYELCKMSDFYLQICSKYSL